MDSLKEKLREAKEIINHVTIEIKPKNSNLGTTYAINSFS